jgi:hypothetical protein
MAAIMVVWCLATLAVRPETTTRPPLAPDLGKKVDREGHPKINEATKAQEVRSIKRKFGGARAGWDRPVQSFNWP